MATLKAAVSAKNKIMGYFEVRGGLRKLEFEHPSGSNPEATYAVVEFVHEARLPPGQPARITLGSHNGVVRELVGIPELVRINRAKPDEYFYRLCGAVTAAQN